MIRMSKNQLKMIEENQKNHINDLFEGEILHSSTLLPTTECDRLRSK